jgi:hypothetical protein
MKGDEIETGNNEGLQFQQGLQSHQSQG